MLKIKQEAWFASLRKLPWIYSEFDIWYVSCSFYIAELQTYSLVVINPKTIFHFWSLVFRFLNTITALTYQHLRRSILFFLELNNIWLAWK